jgi:hypothetical protein
LGGAEIVRDEPAKECIPLRAYTERPPDAPGQDTGDGEFGRAREFSSDKYESERASDHRQALDRLLTPIRILKPLNRQVIVSTWKGWRLLRLERSGDIGGKRGDQDSWYQEHPAFTEEGARTNELSPNDARNVGQVQADGNASMSLEFRKEIGNLERVVRKRHAVGGSACFVVMAVLACFSLSFRI